MGHALWRWLHCAVAVTAVVGALAYLEVGPAKATLSAASGQQARNARTAADSSHGASAQSGYVPPAANLYFGDHGPAVTSVQKRLNHLGYFAGPANGKYGADLEEAVWAFKEVQGLPMNKLTNSVITAAFRHALIHPRQPRAQFPAGGSDRIEVNQTIQVLALYKNNKPHLILHVSSGGGYYFCASPTNCGLAITPDGSYTALSYLAGTITVPLGFMENPVFFIGTSYAIHGGEPVPWYPDSHGCVRIYSDVVKWFHNEVNIGSTPIYIYGKAPYRPRLAA
jgi:L,D-transpeptidase catalytic domain/Putative peptidoglycan binding domain